MSDLHLLTTIPASARLRAGLATSSGRQDAPAAATIRPAGSSATAMMVDPTTTGCAVAPVGGRFPNARPTPAASVT